MPIVNMTLMALTDRLSGMWKQYSDRRAFRQDLVSRHPERSGMSGFGKAITLLEMLYFLNLASPAKAQDSNVTIQGTVTGEYGPNRGINRIPLTFSGEAFTQPVWTPRPRKAELTLSICWSMHSQTRPRSLQSTR